MTNNTIPNVPRELLEVIEQTWRIHYKGGPVTTDIAADAIEKGLGQLRTLLSAPSPANHVEDVRAMVAAPSPAGVDGLEVVGALRYFMDYPDSPHSAPGYITHQFNPASWDHAGEAAGEHKLCRLSDAQAIIDGLRGDLLDTSSERNTMQRDRDAYKLLLDRECTDADAVLMGIGLEPDELRTDGGFLMVSHIVNRVTAERDQQTRRVGELEGLLRACHSALYPFDNKVLEAEINAAMSAGKDGE